MSANHRAPDTAHTHILPCVGRASLFSAPDHERSEARDRRESRAVALCRICPAITQCAETIDPADKWTVRAGLTPADRGHKQEPARDVRTWSICGTGWKAVNRHAGDRTPLCEACLAFRNASLAEARARRKEVAA